MLGFVNVVNATLRETTRTANTSAGKSARPASGK